MRDLTRGCMAVVIYLCMLAVVALMVAALLWLGGFTNPTVRCVETPPLFTVGGDILVGGGYDCP